MTAKPIHYREGVLRDYAAGVPIKVICHKWHVGRTQVHHWRKRAGITLRRPQQLRLALQHQGAA
jgi:hypothetical protein